MTSYSVAIDGNGKPLFGNNVGTSYDKAKLELLRDRLGYDGVVSTDWMVTVSKDEPTEAVKLGMTWGEEDQMVNQRHYLILQNGTDMFGGNNDKNRYWRLTIYGKPII